MTPAAHATEAENLLAVTVAPGAHLAADKSARLAVVHAILAGKAGTGSNYTAAEAELVIAAGATGSHANLARAHAYALLAS